MSCFILWVPLNILILIPKSTRDLIQSLQVQKIAVVWRSWCLTDKLILGSWYQRFSAHISWRVPFQVDALRLPSTCWEAQCAVLCPFTQQATCLSSLSFPVQFDWLQSPSTKGTPQCNCPSGWGHCPFCPLLFTPNKWFRFILKIIYLLLFTITPLMSHFFAFILIHQNKVNSSLAVTEEQGVRLIIKISLEGR